MPDPRLHDSRLAELVLIPAVGIASYASAHEELAGTGAKNVEEQTCEWWRKVPWLEKEEKRRRNEQRNRLEGRNHDPRSRPVEPAASTRKVN